MQKKYSIPISSTKITTLKYISFTIIFTKIEHSHIVLYDTKTKYDLSKSHSNLFKNKKYLIQTTSTAVQ